jgi:hypothetical protein
VTGWLGPTSRCKFSVGGRGRESLSLFPFCNAGVRLDTGTPKGDSRPVRNALRSAL